MTSSFLRNSILALLEQHTDEKYPTDVLQYLSTQSKLMHATSKIRDLIKADPWQIGLKAENSGGQLNTTGILLKDMIEVISLDEYYGKEHACVTAVLHFDTKSAERNTAALRKIRAKNQKAASNKGKASKDDEQKQDLKAEWPIPEKYNGIRVKVHYKRHTNYMPGLPSSRAGSIDDSKKDYQEKTEKTGKMGKTEKTEKTDKNKEPEGKKGDDDDDDEYVEEAQSDLEFSISLTTEPYGEMFPMVHFTATTDDDHPGPFYNDITKAAEDAKNVLKEKQQNKPNNKKSKSNKDDANNTSQEDSDKLLEKAIAFEDPVNVTGFQFNPDLLGFLLDALNLELDESAMVYILLALPFHESEWELEDRICDLLFGIQDEGDEEDEGDLV